MEITKRKSGETIVIELSGSLDIYTATDFKTYLQANVNTDHSKVVVNMEKTQLYRLFRNRYAYQEFELYERIRRTTPTSQPKRISTENF
jgi:hypothetical protein